MTTRDDLTRACIAASVALLDQLLAEERQADPQEFAEIGRALAAGCMLKLHTSFAPSTGLCMLDVELAEPSGATRTLMSIEMQRQAAS